MIDNLEAQLRRDENEVLHAYPDHLGYTTIGVGRLIDKRKGGGITREESAYLLGNDIATRRAQLLVRAPWMADLDPVRFGVLQNMAFQMGVDGLLGFKNTLAMVRGGNWRGASDGMLHSKWATQTPARAKRLSLQMLGGVWK